MTGNSEDLKRQHELGVAADFAAFLRESGYEVGAPRPGDTQGRREPDAVCESPTGLVGIEVADGYYNDSVARSVWGHARDESVSLQWGLLNADLELAKAIEKTLLDHCKKPYSTPTTFLVLNAAHEFLTVPEDAPALLQHINAPAGCQFRGVYLRLKQNFSDRTVFIEVPFDGERGA